jgi:ankyrin repeat protein
MAFGLVCSLVIARHIKKIDLKYRLLLKHLLLKHLLLKHLLLLPQKRQTMDAPTTTTLNINTNEVAERIIQGVSNPRDILQGKNRDLCHPWVLEQTLKKYPALLDVYNARTDTYLIHEAAEIGYIDAIKILIRLGVDINKKTIKDRNTPLICAIKENKTNCVAHLLEHGASVNDQDCFGDTAILIAVKNQNITAIQSLLEYKADVKIYNKNRDTPLTWAAYKKDSYLVDLIIKQSDINHKNIWGNTALIIAAMQGSIAVARKLLIANANVVVRNEKDETAADVAKFHGYEKIEKIISKQEFLIDFPLLKQRLYHSFYSCTDINIAKIVAQYM